MIEQNISELEALLGVLPRPIEEALREENRSNGLLEIVLDLGRLPEARFLDHEVTLTNQEVTRDDIDHVVSGISAFDADNRAGICSSALLPDMVFTRQQKS